MCATIWCMSDARFRSWCFTSFKDDRPLSCGSRYFVCQRERCPDTGREHWQGFVYYGNAVRVSTVKSRIGDASAHIEASRSVKDAIRYCKKEETRCGQVIEEGCVPECGREPGWWRSYTVKELWEGEPEWMLRHYQGVKTYVKDKEKCPGVRKKPRVFVFWGLPGTGKSYAARSIDPDSFYVKPSGLWWDGYDGQNVVIFDDFYGTERYCDILRWLSENPIKVQVKGSSVWLVAETFVFTSNVPVEKWYPNVEDLGALRRRISVIKEFVSVFIAAD